MGTNYYVGNPTPCCPHCGRRSEVYHIGLSSAGWRFQFRGYEESKLTSARQWFDYLADKEIIDEYGRKMSLDDFRAMVESKKQAGRARYASHNLLKHDPEGNPIAFYEFS